MPIVKFKKDALPKAFATAKGFFKILSCNDEIQLIDMTCPHRGGPLTHALENEDFLICPWHKRKCKKINLKSMLLPTFISKDFIFFVIEEKIINVFKTLPKKSNEKYVHFSDLQENKGQKHHRYDGKAYFEEVDENISQRKHTKAYELLKNVPKALSHSAFIQEKLSGLYRQWIPRWHFSMLNDQQRINAFAKAISHADLRNKVVLEIGSGSGILSMLAAKEGAKHVYACEAILPIAEKARQIIQKNKLDHKITIIPKLSSNLKVGVDMPEMADVLISETIDCGFVGEGFLRSLEQAKDYFLKQDAILIPKKFCLKARLIHSIEIANLNQVSQVSGFDVSDFNEFSTKGYFPVRLRTWDHQFLSETFILAEIDLNFYSFNLIRQKVDFLAQHTGKAHGFIIWFETELSKDIWISNNPENTESHWMQAFLPFEAPKAVKKQEKLCIEFNMGLDFIHIAIVD